MKISKSKFDELQNEFDLLVTKGFDRVMEEKVSAGGPMESFHQSASANEQFLRWQMRVSELRKLLKDSDIYYPRNSGKLIEVGSSVVLSKGKDILSTYCIVSSVEANPLLGKISDQSLLGKLLLGKKVGDKIKLKLQDSVILYTIDRVY